MPNEPWGHVVYWTYCHFFGPQFEGKTQNWRTVLRLDANSYRAAKTKSKKSMLFLKSYLAFKLQKGAF